MKVIRNTHATGHLCQKVMPILYLNDTKQKKNERRRLELNLVFPLSPPPPTNHPLCRAGWVLWPHIAHHAFAMMRLTIWKQAANKDEYPFLKDP